MVHINIGQSDSGSSSLQLVANMSYIPPKSWQNNPLNTSKYLRLDEDERKFFKVTTKIEDDAELDQHILDVQAQAYTVSHLRYNPSSL